MQNKECLICHNHGLIESKEIPGLGYCVGCNNFMYLGKKGDYPIHILLREIYQISRYYDILVSSRVIGLIADLCERNEKILNTFAKIILSDIIDIDEVSHVIKEPQSISQYIHDISLEIEHVLTIDYDYCEYIVRLLVFALGKDVSIEPPDISATTADTHFIKEFKQSSSQVLKGGTVDFHWDVRGKKIRIYIQVGNKIYAIKNPRASKRIRFEDKQQVVLIVRSKSNQQELAKRTLSVTVIDKVEILSFEPSRLVSIESMPILLSWNIKNADTIILLPDQIDVTTEKERTVRPNATTTYTLKAYNACSSEERKCTINVRTLPVIERVKIPSVQKSNESILTILFPSFHVTSPLPYIRMSGMTITPKIKCLLPPLTQQKGWIQTLDNNYLVRNIKSLFTYFYKIYKYGK